MATGADPMAPDVSPGAVSKTLGVRRVNNMPVVILAGVLGAFLLVMALVAVNRAAKQNTDYDPKEKAGNTGVSLFAKEITGDQTSGLIEPAKLLAMPPKAQGPILIERPEGPEGPTPSPPTLENAKLNQPANDDEANRIRMMKFQMLEEAVKAKTGVQMTAPHPSGSTSPGLTSTPRTRDEMLAHLAAVRQQIDAVQNEDPTGAYQTRLAQIRSMIGEGGESTVKTSAARGKNSYTQFDQVGEGDRWKLDSQLEAPHSPYELRTGFVVPATLISGINSDLPGQIMAQVAQNVYDTPTGKWLLIPQGSRLIGTYSNDVAYGQARVLVAWQRIVFPDGKAMDIGAMPGTDSAGYAGFNDQVNNHYFRLFGSAFLMSGVIAGITYSQRQNQATNANGAPSASSALSEALGQQLGQVTAQLIAKNMNIAPTLEIRPGYRFNVIVTKDMIFPKPYRSFDY
ncbi:MAG: conjugal transfer protein TrbI [Alphaproteobacteria bacterium 41-28]|nr:MAG: conjugal transfer protein TrbI [Alphaproteobacteria bacterium 41-28]